MKTQLTLVLMMFSLISSSNSWSCDGDKHTAAEAKTPASAQIAANAKSIPGAETTVLQVKGLKCTSCAPKIKAALEKMNGVKLVSLDTKANTAQVVYLPTQTAPQKMVETIEGLKMDFSATVQN